jgi:hypothetical protein
MVRSRYLERGTTIHMDLSRMEDHSSHRPHRCPQPIWTAENTQRLCNLEK